MADDDSSGSGDAATAGPDGFAGELYRALDLAPPYAVGSVVAAALEETFGARAVHLYLADYGEASLEVLDGDHGGSTSLPVEGTSAGRCYRRQEAVADTADGWAVYLPVSVRAERLGVLEVRLAAEPVPQAARAMAQVATAVAYVIISARRYTDFFERVRRRRNLGLAAELQWELLPVLAYDGAEFSLAGALEPAYEVAGDNFDYAVGPDRVSLSVTDGMGHGLRAAMVTSLVVTTTRNARRGGASLLEQVRAANAVVCQEFGSSDHYATVLAAEVDLSTGAAWAVDAGHPPAWLHRQGQVSRLILDPDLPVGLFDEWDYRAQPFALEPGDRLVLYSDGVVEAGPRRGDVFGPERFATLIHQYRHEPPNEFVRRVIREVLVHRGGDLADDATLLCLDWRGRR